MNLEDMRAVQAQERGSDGIQDLPDSFYKEVTTYIEDLRDERAALLNDAEDLYGSEEVRQLTHEIETAEEVAEAIYDRRLAKIVKHASLAAAGMATEETGLTREESALYTALVDRIEDHRQAMIDQFAGRAAAPAATLEASADDGADDPTTDADADSNRPDPDRTDPATQKDEDGTSTAGETFEVGDAMEGADAGGTPEAESDSAASNPTHADANQTSADDDPAGEDESDPTNAGAPDAGGDPGAPEQSQTASEPGSPTGEAISEEQTLLRITRDVGEIMGVDERVYDLAAGDVVSLPSENAVPLLERDAAERIE